MTPHTSIGTRLVATLVAIYMIPALSARPTRADSEPGALRAPVLVSPGAPDAEALILDRCPTFSWAGAEGGGDHELVVYRTDSEKSDLTPDEPIVRAIVPTAATAWTPSISDCLEPGATYAWSVRTTGTEGSSGQGWAEARFFRISSGPSIAEVEEALRVLQLYSAESSDSAHRGGRPLAREVTKSDPATERAGASLVPTPTSTHSAVLPRFEAPTVELGSGAAPAAPALGAASLTLDEQVHLGSSSDFFRDGELFLWADPLGNLGLGGSALKQSTGSSNTAVGHSALRSNMTGFLNSAFGTSSMLGNTTGFSNSAFGVASLLYNTDGYRNSAGGAYALLKNTSGDENSAFGQQAMINNSTGNRNSAFGQQALFVNTTGSLNSAFGQRALFYNDVGSRNTAIGREAMYSTGSTDGTAVGDRALRSNTDGLRNTAVGARALFSSTTGESNVALGWLAGYDLLEGDDNIMIGSGVTGLSTDDKTIRIGAQGTQDRTHIAGISGVPLSEGASVVVESDGRLGVAASSQRFKEDIRAMEDVSDLLAALRPVRFRYKREHSSADHRPMQYGLIAEEVAEVLPELVPRDAEGKALAVRYDLLSTLLLQELRRLSRENDSIDLTQARLLGAQRNEIEALKRQLGRLERRRPH